MKKLNKKQIAEQATLAADLKEKWEAYEAAVNELNQAIVDADQFRADIVSAMDEYMGERSERWPESDAGQAYSEWKDAWEGFELEEIEATEIDAETFSDLPGEPS